MPPARSTGWSAWTQRSTEPTSTPPTCPAGNAPIRPPRPAPSPPWRSPRTTRGTRGAESNDQNRSPTGGGPAVDAQFDGLYDEPVDHGIGRSRGGLSSKIHALVDHDGRPLVVLVGTGQANDSPVFPQLLARLKVARPGRGRPRTRPRAVLADKAYSAR